LTEQEINDSFGVISTPSSSKRVNIIALAGSEVPVAIGRLVYFDSLIAGSLYRAIGTISEMTTNNALMNSDAAKIATSRGGGNLGNSKDTRTSEMSIQAVFVKNDDNEWKQYGSALPNSPTTRSNIFMLTEYTLSDMLRDTMYPSVGYFIGMEAPLPLLLPDFGSRSGAFHTAVLGKSGSGKSSLETFVLAAQMRHESHAILVIDPQGQWSNENGFLFSVQNFAEGLGRKVDVLRVSEDIRLPLNDEIIGKMIDKINLWSKFKRMGPENKEALSQEVAERLVKRGDFSRDPKDVLAKAFEEIALSPSTLARIYASIDRRESLRDQLRMLAGLGPLADDDGVVPIVTAEDEQDTADMWESLLSRFRPIHSLFSPKNFAGTKRSPLSGEKGFLTDVLKVRGDNPSVPAPYVIFDMSPNISLHQKAGLDKDNRELEMQTLLDNEDIKAIILSELLAEIKKASEIAYSQTGGNLNTQIVFDEAWRYAPERSDSEEINALSKELGGFARDTRKFGIGWTYILQSPGDLRSDIWKQLTYVYAGYGLVGEDVKKLESLVDDVAQVDLYRKFISPNSTGVYPFMITGPISPLIFSNSPSFLNAFSDINEFLEYNKRWIREIVARRSLKMIMSTALIKRAKAKKEIVGDNHEEKVFGVGRIVPRPKSQTGDYTKTAEIKAKNKTSEIIISDLIDEPPF
jgi:hypothetical protein